MTRATLFTECFFGDRPLSRENSLIIYRLTFLRATTFVRAFHSSFELRLVKVEKRERERDGVSFLKKDSKASFSFHERREREAWRAGPRSFRIVGETREERRRCALSRPRRSVW